MPLRTEPQSAKIRRNLVDAKQRIFRKNPVVYLGYIMARGPVLPDHSRSNSDAFSGHASDSLIVNRLSGSGLITRALRKSRKGATEQFQHWGLLN